MSSGGASRANDRLGVDSQMRIIIGITGASGAIYGVRLLEVLRDVPEVETHLVFSRAGQLTVRLETGRTTSDVEALADEVHGPGDIAAPISSGSFRADSMIVAPCSMKSLSAIVHSYADNLLSRAADVMLKERRQLIVMPRETPIHLGHARLLVQAAEMGIHLCPPVPAFYNNPQSVDDIVDHSVGRVLDLIGLDLGLVKRWAGAPTDADG
jgi:4-hydroxy-3-polyprenylbenzoate decarboxylase